MVGGFTTYSTFNYETMEYLRELAFGLGGLNVAATLLPVFRFDLVTARIHASLWAGLASEGASVGSHDLLIGATAIALGYRVATRDRRSFGKIPGLEIVVL